MASVPEAVDEGRLLAEYAARLAVKNRIEVATIGEGAVFEAEAFAAGAAEELLRLAEEQDAIGERLEAEAEVLRAHNRPRHVHDYHAGDRRNLRHRARVARALAAALRARSEDPADLLELVENARADAWRDVAGMLEAIIDAGARPPRETGPRRAARLADLADDLATLVAEHEDRGD